MFDRLPKSARGDPISVALRCPAGLRLWQDDGDDCAVYCPGWRALARSRHDHACRAFGDLTDHRRAIETLAATDAQVKGGGRDPVYALEKMVESIASRGER